MSTLLWGVLPYVTIAVLVAGCIWRYRYDQFGWTTRSSQLYESRLPGSAVRCSISASWSWSLVTSSGW